MHAVVAGETACRRDAQADLAMVAPSHRPSEANGGWSAHVVPRINGRWLGGAAMLLLLGAQLNCWCANVANLISRVVGPATSCALSAALGAKRSRLLQQVIVEGLVLSSAGAMLGLLFARWATPLIVALAPAGTPRLSEVTTDFTVVIFTVAIAVACGMAVSLVPGVAASRVPMRTALVEGGRSSSDGRRRLRGLLVAGEIGLAVVLTIGAGLLGRSFLAVLSVDPGFRADHLLTMQIQMPQPYETNEQRIGFYQQLLTRLEAIPGVVSVGGTTRLPLAGTNSVTQVAVEGRVPPDGQWPEADFRRAVHHYFEAMNIPLRSGRLFTDADHAAGGGDQRRSRAACSAMIRWPPAALGPLVRQYTIVGA